MVVWRVRVDFLAGSECGDIDIFPEEPSAVRQKEAPILSRVVVGPCRHSARLEFLDRRAVLLFLGDLLFGVGLLLLSLGAQRGIHVGRVVVGVPGRLGRCGRLLELRPPGFGPSAALLGGLLANVAQVESRQRDAAAAARGRRRRLGRLGSFLRCRALGLGAADLGELVILHLDLGALEQALELFAGRRDDGQHRSGNGGRCHVEERAPREAGVDPQPRRGPEGDKPPRGAHRRHERAHRAGP
mmetsp:Transcript_3696/g.14476  ORF Transcript_3696/g.14476 Transcript_3696/m.14476 type:complete len:243 (+) Transcript_3696:362-1090(+)